MSSIAEEYRQKQNKDKVPSGTEAAANNLWEYEKLIDPKFFRRTLAFKRDRSNTAGVGGGQDHPYSPRKRMAHCRKGRS